MPCSVTPEVFTVGSSSACTFTEVGGIVSITIGTLAGSTEQIAGGGDSAATAAEQTPNVYWPGVAVNVRASSLPPSPFWPVSVTVNVQPAPTAPRPDVGTVIVTRPGVSPDGAAASWMTETCGVPTL